MPAPGPLLEIDRLSCSHAGQPAVAGLGLTLAAGELGCLLGPSGCGKTTLLRTIAGLHAPDAGSLRLRGVDALPLPPEKRGLGFVFQDLALFPHLTVADNVGFGLHRLERGARKARGLDTLALLGLDGLAERYPHELSGGQQQRVAIARALVSDPRILICDEPTGDLDRATADEVLRLLQQLNREFGKTIVMVTHDPKAAEYASRTVHLDKGTLVNEAPAH